jgi:DNA-binding response OmpR family regulator
MHILVIEDEKKVAKALQQGLEREKYRVTLAHTGEDGFYLATNQSFDLLILDLMLPGRDGLEILKSLREKRCQTPVLILTAKDAVDDRVTGLDAGADDYLVKPFAFPELLARIRALTRRGRTDEVLRLRVGDLEIDRVTRRVTRAGDDIQLTAKEYELLEYLALNHGQTVTREMLARDVWETEQRATPLDNVIDVHITRLRQKMDSPYDKNLLRTLRGVGFVLSEDEP